MPTATDHETAERLGRKRARMLPVLAMLFLTQQASYFAGGPGQGDRPVDHLRVTAWLAMSVVLLIVLATGGAWGRSAEVRRLLNDEVTRAHRADAFRYGFFGAMIGCVGLYFLTLFEPLTGREAVHLVMTCGIAAALVRFGMLERRAIADG